MILCENLFDYLFRGTPNQAARQGLSARTRFASANKTLGKEALRKEVLLSGLWLTAGIYQYSFCRYEMDLAAPLLQFPVDSLCQLLLPAVR